MNKITQDIWDLINPAGIIQTESTETRPHPTTLEGKTVLLRWNGKNNGDIFLNRIEELLRNNVKDIHIIRAWDAIPETGSASENMDVSKRLAAKIAVLKPDISIGAQCD